MRKRLTQLVKGAVMFVAATGAISYLAARALEDEVVDRGIKGFIIGDGKDVRDLYEEEWGDVDSETANTMRYLEPESIEPFYENPKGRMGMVGANGQRVFPTYKDAEGAMAPSEAEMKEANRTYLEEEGL